MSEALSLLNAILADNRLEEAQLAATLDAALASEVDVFRYCATTLGIPPSVIMERAAGWSGYLFAHAIPPGLRGSVEPTRLEALAEVRLFRINVHGRDIAFAAPEFFSVIRMKRRLATKPILHDYICLVPEAALREYLVDAAGPALVDGARQNLARRWPYATAQLELTRTVRLGFAVGLVALVIIVLIAPHFAQVLLLPFVVVLLLAPTAIRLAALFEPLPSPPVLRRPADEELPVYTVLIPLHSEAAMVPQLFAAMRALDYPAARLDIKFVVEETSSETIAAVRAGLGDPRFSLVAVTDSRPRTKPKALDFALPLCRGDFVVVFDAEDIPDPDQLWKAAVRFRDDPELVCLQAHLVISNGRRNWLAGQFAGEYAGLFTVLLPALARWRMPMPLGGTSNHFRLDALRHIGGWDAFNVTEDADLGTRLARRRLRVDVLASATREAAPTRFRPWFGQRTRWMKGWMQTYIVHNNSPTRLREEMGLHAFLVWEALVLGMIVAPVLHCAFLATFAIRVALGAPLLDGSLWPAFYFAILAVGYGSAVATGLVGLGRVGAAHLRLSQLSLPLYWALVGAATANAAWDLVRRPFHWFKSPHQPVSAADRATSPKATTGQPQLQPVPQLIT
ncbi:MAG TPA: glycosyltransferase family 2 protein [Devosia sp.]|jgi:cellulose synthase/poly-beta-1,6-N-acetylglucosamine synthase-like glycosyltransferase|uniref:glycosyltransferase family 2 protein n=1 Tax=Devosia sp. TaxID=1871048 RepID=UPI002F9322C4